MEESLKALNELKKEGKIRAVGVCNFGPRDLSEICEKAGFDVVSNQLPYNALFRAIEFEVSEVCEKHKTQIIAYSALAQGLLTGKYRQKSDCRPGIARSRLFHHSSSSMSRHKGEGAEKEMFEAISKLEGVSSEACVPLSTLALKWVLTKPLVNSAIFGATDLHQLKENVQAVHSSVEDSILKKIDSITEPVRQKLGTNCDMWLDESRYR